jgi:cell division septation protein DedD
MNTAFDTEIETRQSFGGDQEREISLGTATILGIFFVLAMVCAAFFGFGYTLGRKSVQTAALPATVAPSAAPITLKPAAGSVAEPTPTPIDPATTTQVVTPTDSSGAATLTSPVVPANAPVASDKPAAAGNAQPATSPNGAFMVQIAAVSSQEIADIELAALKKYGFDVVVRHEPQDQLLHIQIGPYATRKDAQAMQAIVLAHGFNAIVK